MIFFICMCKRRWPKQVYLISWNALLKSRTRRMRYTLRRQVLDYAKNCLRWGNLSNKYIFLKKISICLPKRLKRSYVWPKLVGPSRRKEDRESRQTTRQTRPVAIQYDSVRPKKDRTALLHSTNTPHTITRKYAFMVIPRINIKRLIRMLSYSSYKKCKLE